MDLLTSLESEPTATVMQPSRNTAGEMKSQSAGESQTETRMPRSCAMSRISRFTLLSPVQA